VVTTAETLSTVLENLAICLSLPIERSNALHLLQTLDLDDLDQQMAALIRSGRLSQMRLIPARLRTRDLFELIRDGYPVAVCMNDTDLPEWWIFAGKSDKKFSVTKIFGKKVTTGRFDKSIIRRALSDRIAIARPNYLVAQRLLISGSNAGQEEADTTLQQHPFRRLWRFFSPDYRDIGAMILFGTVAGLLGLTTPLAVEWVVSTVAFGRYLQPLVVLSLMMFVLLTFAGMMRVLQAFVVEMIQRRFFARVVGDLAFRLPNAQRAALNGTSGSELLNRFLDVATIQKATATILLDGITISLNTIIGMILLAVYHPFLLGFDIALLGAMIFAIFVLGQGGIRTSIEESAVKYEITHWLQDVISKPIAFRFSGGEAFSIDRANRLTVQYLDGRRRHFRVLVRQMIFAVMLQAVASMALLGIGGWLVLQKELTLGQLVASELVITVIIGSFAKISKSLETFYDLMASTDKVGYILDLPLDIPARPLRLGNATGTVSWRELVFVDDISKTSVDLGSASIAAKERVVLVSDTTDKPSRLLKFLAGLDEAVSGYAEIAGIDSRDASRSALGQIAGYAGPIEIFAGTVLENLSIRRPDISIEDVYWALDTVDLKESLLQLPAGLETKLQTDGYPLSHEKSVRLMIARAIVSRPNVVLLDQVLDVVPLTTALKIKDRLCDAKLEWTILLASNNQQIRAGLKILPLN
jgi:putative ABC transport system ATP-binding protein